MYSKCLYSIFQLTPAQRPAYHRRTWTSGKSSPRNESIITKQVSSDVRRRAHLIGVAGAGMGALAEVMAGQGWRIRGSDAALRRSRGRILAGHAAGHLKPDTDLVVYSDAIPPDNPERRQAAQLGIPAVRYAEMLGRLMHGRHGLVVAGTHGKSTTTAMAAEILQTAGLEPTVVCGATPLRFYSGSRAGQGDLMLVEGCEYRQNFLHLHPRAAVITGIEADHFDCYPTCQAVERAFSLFVRTIPKDGLLLANIGCRGAMRVIHDKSGRVETFGLAGEADWLATDLAHEHGKYRFQLTYRGRQVGHVSLREPGKHNVLNALAAAALSASAGASDADIRRGLSIYGGLRRRLETVGRYRGVTLLDDYAHHPTEITASLATVRQMYPGKRLWCVFQPHQISRTRYLLDEIAHSLHNADKIAVADIFRAREAPGDRPAVTAADVAAQLRSLGADVLAVHEMNQIKQQLAAQLGRGRLDSDSVLITMGAGDIWKVSHGLANRI